MPRLTRSEYKGVYAYLVSVYGEACHYKSDGLCKGRLIVHHVDNNSENNVLRNLRLACNGHNQRLNPRGVSVRGKRTLHGLSDPAHKMLSLCVGMSEDEKLGNGAPDYDYRLEKARRPSPELEKSRMMKPIFEAYLEAAVAKAGRLKADDAVDTSAKLTGGSQTTMRRYLNAECSAAGKFKFFNEEGVQWIIPRPEDERTVLNPDAK